MSLFEEVWYTGERELPVIYSRWAEPVFWGSLSQAAARLWSSKDWIYFRILEMYRSEYTS